MNSRTCLLVVGFLYLCQYGCITKKMYEGLNRPDEEIASVECNFKLLTLTRDACFITHVDGVSTYGNGSTFMGKPYYMIDQVDFLPGKRSITFRNDRNAVFGITILSFSETLDFVAEAGHTYKLEIDEKDEKFYFWIFDEDTEEIVSGTQRWSPNFRQGGK